MNLTVTEAAAALGVTEANVYKAIKEGRLPAEKLYGRLTIRPADVEAYRPTVGVRNGYVKRAPRRPEGEGPGSS